MFTVLLFVLALMELILFWWNFLKMLYCAVTSEKYCHVYFSFSELKKRENNSFLYFYLLLTGTGLQSVSEKH
jgi:hypothetical protein